MARKFSAATDKVNHGRGAGLDTLPACTFAAWIYPTTVDGRIFQKGVGTPFHLFALSSGVTSLWLEIARATQSLLVQTALTNFTAWGLSKWVFAAATYNAAGVNSDQKLYVGDATTPPSLPSSYSVGQRVGSGTQQDNSAADLYVGNKENDNAAMQGLIAWPMVFNRYLSARELALLHIRPWMEIPDRQFFSEYLGGTPILDLSGHGHHGTPTGTIITPDEPPIGYRRRGRVYVPAASGGAQSLTPAAAVVTVSGIAPTLVPGGAALQPAAAAVTVSAPAPTMVAGGVALQPAAAAVTVTAPSPNLVPGTAALTPSAAVVTVAGVDPSFLVAGGPQALAPAAAQVTVTGIAPTLGPGAVVLSPAPAAVTVTAPNPVLVPGALVLSTPAAAVQVSGVGPALVAGGAALLPPPAVVVVIALNPTILGGTTYGPSHLVGAAMTGPRLLGATLTGPRVEGAALRGPQLLGATLTPA